MGYGLRVFRCIPHLVLDELKHIRKLKVFHILQRLTLHCLRPCRE